MATSPGTPDGVPGLVAKGLKGNEQNGQQDMTILLTILL